MTRDQEVHVPAFKVNAVDTSGAGDAFIGCFSHYYVQSGDVEAALKSSLCRFQRHRERYAIILSEH